MIYSILSKNIESSTKEVMLALYQGRLAEYGDFYLVHGDVRHVLTDLEVDESIKDLELGGEEGQTPVATFVADMDAIRNGDISDRKTLLINHQCAAALIDALYTVEEEEAP